MQSDSIPAGTIARPSRALFALALDAQEIDGELALAMGLLSSEDPDERQQGEELIAALLETASEANDALVARSDQLLEMAQWLQARAAHLKATAKQRLEAAAREEEAADALIARVGAVLHFRNPGQTTFALPEHKLASRKIASVEVTDLSAIPDRYAGVEVKIRVPATGAATNHETLVQEVIDQLDNLGVAGEVLWEKKPDKKLITARLRERKAFQEQLERMTLSSEDSAAAEAALDVPGATLEEGRSWRIA